MGEPRDVFENLVRRLGPHEGFRVYASPERDLVLDLNDFNEAHPGPWEWNLRRLVTSFYVAGRQSCMRDAQCDDAVMSCVVAYRQSVRLLANQPLLSRSFQRMDVPLLHSTVTGESLRAMILAPRSSRALERATGRCRDSPPN